jgi:hypothetical protein
MLRRMLCSALCVGGLAGTLMLVSGCGGGGVDKTGPATAPQDMDQQKKTQYEQFMKQRGGGGGGGGGAPVAPPPHG